MTARAGGRTRFKGRVAVLPYVVMHCALCGHEMRYVHGHAACVHGGCPLFGVNQAECCSGETASCGPLTTEVAAVRAPSGQAPAGPAALKAS
jgi:hypothetical protein